MRSDMLPSNQPGANDLVQSKAQPSFIGRLFIGECGILNTNMDAATSAWIEGMAAQATRPLSLGGVQFGDQDFTSPTELGNYGITGHAAMETAAGAWPGGQL